MISPVATLDAYLNSTMDLRGTETHLFIALNKPHKKLSSQTLSHCINKTLQDKTSAAKRSGISIDVIKKAAGWTERSRTFAKFYDRNVINDKRIFAKSILNRNVQ